MEYACGVCDEILSEEEVVYHSCLRGCQEVLVTEENKLLRKENDAPDLEQEDIDFEESLIREIEIRPALWDHRIALFRRTKQIKIQSWQDLSLIFNKEVEDLQKKWRYLRDTFVKNKAENDAYVASGSSTKKKKPEWKFYNSLQFLQDVVQIKRTTNIKFSPPASPPTSSSSNEELNLTTPKNFTPELGRERTRQKNKKDSIQSNGELDNLLIEALKAPPLPPPPTPITETDGFLVMIGAGLNRVPRKIRSDLQIKMLQMLNEAENEFA